ncbi:MAG: DUF87 domain-containing protein, partial [Aquificaceae bacterium]|nr:DUF87 domain-containing protein [Aquificaceae bacterium]
MQFLTSNEIYENVKEAVKKASENLKLASAWIRGRYFEELLEIVKHKNLELEVIIRASEARDFEITDEMVFKKIKEVGGKVYLCNRLHAKFLIVDDKEVILGSANYTESGLSDISVGNIEAGAYYSDDETQVKRAVEYFKSIKEYSYLLSEDLIGFALNPVRPRSFEFVLVGQADLNSYVEVKTQEGLIIGRVDSVFSYNTGFFANPFTSRDSDVLAPIEDFKKIFSKGEDQDWKKFAVYSYLNSKSSYVKIATAEVIGVLKGSKLEMPKKPFEVGAPVYKASRESLQEALKKNTSGYEMSIPVLIGKLKDTDVAVYLDAQEILKKHFLIVGTTGSGKSYFVKKKLIPGLLKSVNDLQIVIFDPHGEYYDEIGNKSESIELVKFEDILFPTYPEELSELIEESGFANLVKGNSNIVKDNNSMFA